MIFPFISQIKKVRSLIDEAIEKNKKCLSDFERERDELLKECGNWLHESVPESNNEVFNCQIDLQYAIGDAKSSRSGIGYFIMLLIIQEADNRTERTFGDTTQRKKYSHVDLIHMIGGADLERGTVTAGGRGYYLMGPAVCLQVKE